ncbi:DUF1003 domain-containing protein [Sulfurimonas sp. HSL1-2]|uniref:DUF1003 domain-containing protein n=1 Tax=Thiomicrolovo zhangzhouensis TaxID=3131933 RepID=UPI0031F75B7E
MKTKNLQSRETCAVCGKPFVRSKLVSGESVRQEVADEIRKDHPEWSHEKFICRPDLSTYRGKYVQSLVESEMGELTSLENEVLRSLTEHELLSANIEDSFEKRWSLGERMADRLASFGGSWTFLMLFALFLLLWIGINSAVLYVKPVDPYPYIFLNLLLSCLAAIQAPIIMMSQNRQEAKDRLRSQHDYQVNLKSELEIRHLHEKIDHLMTQQWERLVQIQKLQVDLLSDLGERK